jgi:carboxymethylenebutenolidase
VNWRRSARIAVIALPAAMVPQGSTGPLQALGVDHDVKEYPDAGHPFLNDLSLPSSVRTPAIFVVMGKFNGPAGLHEPSAADARQRIVSFFNRHLQAAG